MATGDFRDHTNCLIDNELWIWGGDRPGVQYLHDSQKKRRFTSTIDVLNLSNSKFNKHQTTGTPPNGILDYRCCSIGNDIYYFGGSCTWLNSCYHNNLFILNSRRREWREIECDDGPMKKHGCGLIPFSMNGQDYILVIGGQGPLPSNPPSHAKYIYLPYSFLSECFTNEVHIMCVSTTPGKWTIPIITGSVFPPSAYFSINTLPGNRAIIFGGQSINEHNREYQSNVFILSYTNKTVDFIRLDHTSSIPWPEDRSDHSSVTITSVSSTGVEKHYLVVLGGWLRGSDMSTDSWILDFERKRWKQIRLPEDVTKRYRHSTSCYNMSMNCVWLVITGGSINDKFISTPNRLMIIELVYSPTDDNWTVSNVLDERDMKNRKKYFKLQSESKRENQSVDEGLLVTGGYEQVQLLKQQLKQNEEEIARLTAELEQERTAHATTTRQHELELLETNHRSEEIIRGKDVLIRLKDEIVQQKDGLLQERDATIERKEAEILELQEQLDNRPWILQREEVKLTDTKLGGGAYGEVRVGIFRGTRVAAKRMHQIIVSEYNLGVFTREMEISARIHHPNIVQFIGATRVDNPILLYELMTTSLHNLLQEGRRPLTRPQIVTIASNICSAMCYLHQWRPQPIIHRDISSPNVLMEPLPNDKWKAKLSDFGSANLQLRIKTDFPGNTAYAAPEAGKFAHHSPAMDVYSFGILLTEITLHRAPEMDSSKRYRRAQGIAWPDMREIVLKCINNDRTQRLTSMDILDKIQQTLEE